tara:strand:+ start:381 stop:653 length:273 start_codon:yes stop_codon:yes gene_type:complete
MQRYTMRLNSLQRYVIQFGWNKLQTVVGKEVSLNEKRNQAIQKDTVSFASKGSIGYPPSSRELGYPEELAEDGRNDAFWPGGGADTPYDR